MRFTVLGHAALLVEHGGRSVLIDPWLVGSTYWRSWWNYPEVEPALLASLRPDYIYLTHLHWDHFHGPSLRKFSRGTHCLVPKVHTRRMVEDLHAMGFKTVTEIPHGGSHDLGAGLRLFSYQFGVGSDSAAILTDGRTTLFNANDCKLFGGALRQILRRFPTIDFVFRSYSSASSIPYCIEGYETRYPDFRSADNYIEEFGNFSLHVGARYTIPFASNHCFLHRDTARFNPTSVSPRGVERHANAQAATTGLPTRCVVMAPGSSWSDAGGFELRPFDYDRDREAYIETLQTKYAAKLEDTYRREAKVRPNFRAFERYMRGALATIPRWAPRIRSLRVVFETKDGDEVRRWLVDFGRREVKPVEEVEPGTLVVAIDAAVLNDCTQKRMFCTLGPSKRLRFRLPEEGTWIDVRLLLSLLEFHELEFFPLRRHLTLRYLSIWLRRWREFGTLLRLGIAHKLLRRPFRVADLYPIPAAARGGTGSPSGQPERGHAA
jgi:UDP-MurNAc hydroxylase